MVLPMIAEKTARKMNKQVTINFFLFSVLTYISQSLAALIPLSWQFIVTSLAFNLTR